MNQHRKRKLITIAVIASVLAVATALVLYALSQNISLFYSPTQLAEGKAPVNHPIRVGGMVVDGSVIHSKEDLSVRFKVTDYQNTVEIVYLGILPDLFREGQGIVAQGRLASDGRFSASEVLAKHDENYMPPEVRGSLKS